MQALGTTIEFLDSTTLLIEGTGRKFQAASEPLDCGNSGTSMRLLAGLLAGQAFDSKLFGDASLSNRPMRRIIDPLTRMGAKVMALGEKGTPPLEIHGTPLRAIQYDSPIASAQVKSCILLAGFFAEGTTTVKEPIKSRDHTEQLLKHFYANPVIDGLTVAVHGGTQLHGHDLAVPGDFSSAAFWLVAAAAAPNAKLAIHDVGLNSTRTGLLSVLVRMGAQVTESIQSKDAEPSGTLQVTGCRLRGTTIGGEEIPNVIDELPILAVAGALAEGDTIIKDASELRVKETDRIHAMATNLRAFGVEVDETPDGMIIHGGAEITGAKVESFGDHRIAMACAILALFAKGSSVIHDTQCINTSYPGFAEDLQRIATPSRLTPGRSLRARRPKTA
jgi:3-phosphoshikimate 1-carboxyvinyltransferase